MQRNGHGRWRAVTGWRAATGGVRGGAMGTSRRPGNAVRHGVRYGVRYGGVREIFNTKGHKELLSGLYRSTKTITPRSRKPQRFLRVSAGVASRHGQWRGGGGAGCKGAHRAEARRREPGGPAAKHRALPPSRTRKETVRGDTSGAYGTGHEGATRVRGQSLTGGASGVSHFGVGFGIVGAFDREEEPFRFFSGLLRRQSRTAASFNRDSEFQHDNHSTATI